MPRKEATVITRPGAETQHDMSNLEPEAQGSLFQTSHTLPLPQTVAGN